MRASTVIAFALACAGLSHALPRPVADAAGIDKPATLPDAGVIVARSPRRGRGGRGSGGSGGNSGGNRGGKWRDNVDTGSDIVSIVSDLFGIGTDATTIAENQQQPPPAPAR